jgi:inorganic pyrophosphatase
MNVNTGELRMLAAGAERDKELLKALMEEGFRPVPQELQEEAAKELNGKEETFVNLKGSTPLAKWAKNQREKDKKKAKRKLAKASRKLNR